MNQLRTARFLGLLSAGALFGAILCHPSTAQKEVSPPKKQNSQPSKTVLKNGNMSLGTKVPGFWHHRWVGTGKIKIFRDTQVFKEGPAALSVSGISSTAKGQASQLIKGFPGQVITLSGFAKSTGKAKVNVAVQSFSKQSKPIDFQSIKFLQNNQDWVAFSQAVTLPPKTNRFGVALLLEGEGQAWLDEVKLTGQGTQNIAGNPDKLPPPKKQDPTVPTRGHFPKFPDAWFTLHEQHLKMTRKRPIEVVFLGDSITQQWQKHKPLWQKHYGKLGAANFGIGGDRTQQVLWRIEHGLFDQTQPQLVVLNIGVNNLLGNSSDATRIAEGVEKIIDAIQAKSPQTKVLLLGIFPTGKQPNAPVRQRVKAVNTLLAQLDNDQDIRFLDIGEQFLQPNGQISKMVMPDSLHLSQKGYQIWADAMADQFQQMLQQ